jgi:hypothetical protein
MNGDLYLDDTKLTPYGRKFTITDEPVERSTRTITGKLLRDIVAVKKVFTLDYNLIDGNALNYYLSKYDEQDELILSVHSTDDPDDAVDYIVLIDAITRTREVMTADGLWSGVSIVLREV